MMILRGIHNLLDEKSALEYARRRGYGGFVLDASGETGPNSDQTLEALEQFRKRPDVAAIYGFSGGGYNVRHIINRLSRAEKDRIKLIVVVGAPGIQKELFTNGPWELVYRKDPPSGVHMDGPKALLAELGPEKVIIASSSRPWWMFWRKRTTS